MCREKRKEQGHGQEYSRRKQEARKEQEQDVVTAVDGLRLANLLLVEIIH